jgi:hypothetical protein
MFSPFAVRDAHAETSGAIRVLFSQLLATFRGPGKFPTIFRAIVFLPRERLYPERELGPALLTSRFKALKVASTSAEPENAIGRMRGIYCNALIRGVRACTIVAILFGSTPRISIANNCFHAYSMRSGWPRPNFLTYPGPR